MINEDITDFLMIVIENENLKEEYERVKKADLLTLPTEIDKFSEAFQSKNKALYKAINKFQIYNDLFRMHRLKAAYKTTMNLDIDVKLSEEKVINIYNNYANNWVPNKDIAMQEINNFIDFLKILNS